MTDYKRDSVDATLSRIETKLNQALQAQDAHEKRIGELERKIWPAFGVIGFLVFVVPLVTHFLKL